MYLKNTWLFFSFLYKGIKFFRERCQSERFSDENDKKEAPESDNRQKVKLRYVYNENENRYSMHCRLISYIS